jgi:hypothetical protein
LSYCQEERIKHSTYGWSDRLKQDVKAFEVFVKEHQVKPIAIEMPLISLKYKIGGALDLVCQMRIGTGQNGAVLKSDIKYDKEGNIKEDKTRWITAIIDWKSGRNGFYPEHEVQLHLYKPLWEENFPNILIDSVFNWAPKDWESEPDYKLKCQDNSLERFNTAAYLSIFFNSYNSKKSKLRPIITGIAYLDRGIEPVTFESTEQHLLRRFYKNESESEKASPVALQILDAVIDANAHAIKQSIRNRTMPNAAVTSETNGSTKNGTVNFEEGLGNEEEAPIISEKHQDLVEKVREKYSGNGKIHNANGNVVVKEPSEIADEVQNLVKDIFELKAGEV